MKKIVIFSLFFAWSFAPLFSQDDDYYSNDNAEKIEKKEKKAPGENKWLIGGNIGLQFGPVTYINISPVAMYRVNKRLMVGPGFIYVYEKYKDYNYEASTYGVRVLAEFALFTNLQESIGIGLGDIVLHAENEFVKKDLITSDGKYEGRGWIDNLLVGGGIYQRFGTRGGGMTILCLFDVTQNKYSTYANPIIQFGFFF